MKKGILTIGLVWLILNIIFYSIFGVLYSIVCNYCCMSIIWFGRKKIIKILKI